eukprot:4278686-Pleurochrysis_carterae.AAC.2
MLRSLLSRWPSSWPLFASVPIRVLLPARGRRTASRPTSPSSWVRSRRTSSTSTSRDPSRACRPSPLPSSSSTTRPAPSKPQSHPLPGPALSLALALALAVTLALAPRPRPRRCSRPGPTSLDQGHRAACAASFSHPFLKEAQPGVVSSPTCHEHRLRRAENISSPPPRHPSYAHKQVSVAPLVPAQALQAHGFVSPTPSSTLAFLSAHPRRRWTLRRPAGRGRVR